MQPHDTCVYVHYPDLFTCPREGAKGCQETWFPFQIVMCEGRNSSTWRKGERILRDSPHFHKHRIRHRSNFALVKACNSLRSVVSTFQISVSLICQTRGFLPGDLYDVLEYYDSMYSSLTMSAFLTAHLPKVLVIFDLL